MTLFNF